MNKGYCVLVISVDFHSWFIPSAVTESLQPSLPAGKVACSFELQGNWFQWSKWCLDYNTNVCYFLWICPCVRSCLFFHPKLCSFYYNFILSCGIACFCLSCVAGRYRHVSGEFSLWWLAAQVDMAQRWMLFCQIEFWSKRVLYCISCGSSGGLRMIDSSCYARSDSLSIIFCIPRLYCYDLLKPSLLAFDGTC